MLKLFFVSSSACRKNASFVRYTMAQEGAAGARQLFDQNRQNVIEQRFRTFLTEFGASPKTRICGLQNPWNHLHPPKCATHTVRGLSCNGYGCASIGLSGPIGARTGPFLWVQDACPAKRQGDPILTRVRHQSAGDHGGFVSRGRTCLWAWRTD